MNGDGRDESSLHSLKILIEKDSPAPHAKIKKETHTMMAKANANTTFAYFHFIRIVLLFNHQNLSYFSYFFIEEEQEE